MNGESVKWENKWNKSAENINFLLALLLLARFYLTQLISDKYKKIIKEGKGIQFCTHYVRIFLLFRLDFLQSHFSSSKKRKKNEEKLKMIFLFIVLQAFIGEWWYFTLVYTNSLSLSPSTFIFDQFNRKKIKNEEILLLFFYFLHQITIHDSYNGNDGATAEIKWFEVDLNFKFIFCRRVKKKLNLSASMGEYKTFS